MPPAVRKQMATAKKPTKGTIEDRIVPLSQLPITGLKTSVYGRGKTGKTRFACTFPKPLLLMGTEEGTKSLDKKMPGVDFIPIESSSDIDELVKLAKWKTMVLDHASGLQDIVLKEVLGLVDVPVQLSWGIAKQQDWGTVAMQMKERLRVLLQMSKMHGTNVVIIAHERNFNEESSDSDLIFPTVGSALSPSIAGWLNGAVDYICQTYVREQTVEKQLRIGNKISKRLEKTDKKEFALRVGPHPVFMTGFRLPPGTELPDSIVDPSYDKIVKLIKG